MAACKHSPKCHFYNRYKNTLDSNCKQYILRYCHGCDPQSCKRYEFRKAHGFPALAKFTPTGGVVIEIGD